MDFSKTKFTKTSDLRGTLPRAGTKTVRFTQEFAQKHGYLVNGMPMRMVVIDHGLQPNGSMIVELRGATTGGVAGKIPHGTPDVNGKSWSFSASRWLPNLAEHLDVYHMQDMAIHVVPIAHSPSRIYIDLSEVVFGAKDKNATPEQMEALLEPAVLLSEATLAQVAERLMELAND